MFRSRAAKWFEVLCPRADGARVAALLATTGAVQIETRETEKVAYRLRELEQGLIRYRALLPTYGRYWKRIAFRYFESDARPRVRLRSALQRIDEWRREADPLIDQIQSLEEELGQLQIYRRVLAEIQGQPIDFDALSRAGPFLEPVIAVVPPKTDWSPGESFVFLRISLDEEDYLLALGPGVQTQALRDELKEQEGRLLRLPRWLHGDTQDAALRVRARSEVVERSLARFYAELDGLHQSFHLGETLSDLASLDWFVDQVGPLSLASSGFVRITGWTSDRNGGTLIRALESVKARALIDFPPVPPDVSAPQLFDNPWWSRPFEIFPGVLGTPAADETDPTPLLAFVVPLLFGFMFGDVGQGLVLIAAGVMLRRLIPARLLIICGLSATLFGFLFGSVFSREDWIGAIWLHPMEQPLAVLWIPLLLGMGLLVLGQVFNGLEAKWRGELSTWMGRGAGFLLSYLGLVGTLIWPPLLLLSVFGFAWYLVSGALETRSSLALVTGTGQFLEETLRILANTVSFARVGAFALAHAGLSSAISTLADASSSLLLATMVMILGNLIVIFLEGLVVSIQATRLILFEFFSRFVRGEGRRFLPISPPPVAISGESR